MQNKTTPARANVIVLKQILNLIPRGMINRHALATGVAAKARSFSGLDYWRAKLTRQTLTPWLIHGGTARQDREMATVLPWNDLAPLLNLFT